MIEKTKLEPCQGTCEKHVGEVSEVAVSGWGTFFYCEEAIAEDKRRGLTVYKVQKREAQHD
jgi:hypothetical protein